MLNMIKSIQGKKKIASVKKVIRRNSPLLDFCACVNFIILYKRKRTVGS